MLRENVDGGLHAGHGAPVSYWPIVLAATISIAFIGLMIGPVVWVVAGVASVAAMVAWGVQRFPGPGAEVEEHAPGERLRVPSLALGEAETETPLELGRSPAWWGMVWFIATEATFFVFLIGSYVYLRLGAASWPPPNVPHRDLVFPAVNTVILLASGIPAYFGHRAIRNGNRRGLVAGLLASALLGTIFLAGQGYEYLASGLSPTSSVFAAGFYVLTGFHGAHVAAGITILVVMAIIARRFSRQHHFGVEFASTYWHFVDAVWILLFILLYVLE